MVHTILPTVNSLVQALKNAIPQVPWPNLIYHPSSTYTESTLGLGLRSAVSSIRLRPSLSFTPGGEQGRSRG